MTPLELQYFWLSCKSKLFKSFFLTHMDSHDHPIIRQRRNFIISVIIASLFLPSSSPLKHSTLLQLAKDAWYSLSSSTTEKHNSRHPTTLLFSGSHVLYRLLSDRCMLHTHEVFFKSTLSKEVIIRSDISIYLT